MLGAIGKILGSGKVIEKGINLIDSMHTSTEEEIAAKTRAKTNLLTAYAPFKIAQRYLALMFGFGYMFSFVVSLGLGLYDNPSVETVTAIMTAFKLPYIMLMIVGFYFGGGAFEGGVEAVKKRRDKKESSDKQDRPGPPNGR